MKNYLIYGAQGSGKSTFAPYIAEKLGVTYLATGAMFREEMEKQTEVGKAVRERMNNGVLIDDATTWEILKPHLQKATQGFLLDGFPRNLQQVAMLEEAGYQVEEIFYLNLPEEVAIKRLLARGREDDTEEGIRTRLSFYKNQTLPVIDYYKGKGIKFTDIDNTEEVEVVRERINDYLKN